MHQLRNLDCILIIAQCVQTACSQSLQWLFLSLFWNVVSWLPTAKIASSDMLFRQLIVHGKGFGRTRTQLAEIGAHDR